MKLNPAPRPILGGSAYDTSVSYGCNSEFPNRLERITRTSESEIEEVARTISGLAGRGMRPKQLVEVRKKHPDATKKEISHAAFYAVILAAEKEPARAEALHELASVTRNEFDD